MLNGLYFIRNGLKKDNNAAVLLYLCYQKRLSSDKNTKFLQLVVLQGFCVFYVKFR